MQMLGLTLAVVCFVSLIAQICGLVRARNRAQARANLAATRWLDLHAAPRPAKPRLTRSAAWTGRRRFVVERKEHESEGVVSLYLVPQDRKPLPSFEPGQFITLELPVPGANLPVKRCYSLSHAPSERFYRITVKRVPDGLGSRFVHQQVEVGTRIDVHAPAGRFVIDRESSRPIVLIAGGIGITPFLSMLHNMAAWGERPVTLIYSLRNGLEHTGRDEVSAIAAQHANVRIYTIYTAPNATDAERRDFDASNRISLETLQTVLPDLMADFHICGSAEMTRALTQQLVDAGVASSSIRSEGFGGRIVPKPPQAESSETQATPTGARSPSSFAITFKASAKSVTLSDATETVLECAERHGVSIDSSCRSGSCGTCQVALLEGAVAAIDGSDAAAEHGTCLPCIAQPTSDIVLNA